MHDYMITSASASGPGAVFAAGGQRPPPARPAPSWARRRRSRGRRTRSPGRRASAGPRAAGRSDLARPAAAPATRPGAVPRRAVASSGPVAGVVRVADDRDLARPVERGLRDREPPAGEPRVAPRQAVRTRASACSAASRCRLRPGERGVRQQRTGRGGRARGRRVVGRVLRPAQQLLGVVGGVEEARRRRRGSARAPRRAARRRARSQRASPVAENSARKPSATSPWSSSTPACRPRRRRATPGAATPAVRSCPRCTVRQQLGGTPSRRRPTSARRAGRRPRRAPRSPGRSRRRPPCRRGPAAAAGPARPAAGARTRRQRPASSGSVAQLQRRGAVLEGPGVGDREQLCGPARRRRRRAPRPAAPGVQT